MSLTLDTENLRTDTRCIVNHAKQVPRHDQIRCIKTFRKPIKHAAQIFSSYNAIALERKGRLLTITLNRPERRNTYSCEMIVLLAQAGSFVKRTDGMVASIPQQ